MFREFTWKPCPLPATIRPPNKVVKEVAQLWDQLQLSQLLLHLLPMLPHQEQPQNIEDLDSINQVIDQARAGVGGTASRIRLNDQGLPSSHLIADVVVNEPHPVINFCRSACKAWVVGQPKSWKSKRRKKIVVQFHYQWWLPACMFHKSGQKSWHRENQLLIDIPHRDESNTALLNVLLVQGRLVLKDVQVTDGDGQQLAEAGQLTSLQPCQDLLQVRNCTQVEGGLSGHQDVLNHLAGVLIEGGVDKLVKAEDEKLISFSQQLWCLLVQQTELAQHLRQEPSFSKFKSGKSTSRQSCLILTELSLTARGLFSRLPVPESRRVSRISIPPSSTNLLGERSHLI